VKLKLLLAALAFLPVAAQQPETAPRESFEVASVKPNKSGDRAVRIMIAPGGRFRANNVTLKMLIGMAYRVQPFQISGDSGWMDSDRFDIEAKPPEGFAQPPMNPEDPAFQRADEVRRRMVQSLLADRFHLQVHRETKEMPVYALVIGKNGSKLKPSAPPPPDADAPGPKGPMGPGRRFQGMRMGRGELEAQSAAVAFLAQSLSNALGRTVIDETGLKGTFDFTLKWTPDESQGPMMRPPGEAAAPPPDASGPDIFTAIQEQLGLKLESKKGPVDILVIDHAEPPSAN
jgi:uncharacterized protein (TIGR03435 family)